MSRKRRHSAIVATLAAAALVGAMFAGTQASADAVATARSASYGINLAGPVPIEALPLAQAGVPKESPHEEDSLVEVPADPLATSFTAHVVADASKKSAIAALLQPVMDTLRSDLPTKWNARAYAALENLSAVTGQLKADVIESEAVAGCNDGKVVYSGGAYVANLTVAGSSVHNSASPNQTVFDQLGIRIVFFETNWDPSTGGLTDDSDTIYVNALHVTAPGGVDIVVSHSEATGTCAEERELSPPLGKPQCSDLKDNDRDGKIDFPADPGCESRQDDDERDGASPAAPLKRQPLFTG